jgi:hypothetical protein
VTVEYVLFATIMRMVEHQSAKFSVFSLVIREFDHGDWFASDCTIRQRVTANRYPKSLVRARTSKRVIWFKNPAGMLCRHLIHLHLVEFPAATFNFT